MKVLIVGLGSIARKHIYVLRQLNPEVEISALRSSKESPKYNGVQDFYSYSELKKEVFDFAIVCSPTIKHLGDIEACLRLNIPLMVEKPLFFTIDQIKKFETMYTGNQMIYVACNMRFHPMIEFVKNYLVENASKINEVIAYCGSYLPDWRPGADYRNVYSARKDLGGGVNLDLIHEPDYLIYLFGFPEKVFGRHKKVSTLEIDTYDSSFYFFEYKKFNAQIVLNYYRRDTKRTLEIVRDTDTIRVDFIRNNVFDLNSNRLLYEDLDATIYTSYQKQMEYFISCIKEDQTPMNSANEAIKILRAIL